MRSIKVVPKPRRDYATLEPLGKPGGSRAFSADGLPNRLWLRDAYRSQPEAETEEI